MRSTGHWLAKRTWALGAIALALAGSLRGAPAIPLGQHHWPTPNRAILEQGGLDRLLQPTASGKLESALFGCVRNDGERFHEGIDLKPISRDAAGEATDAIYAFEDGVVRYVNLNASKSSFGRYIVVEHPGIAAGVVSVYAHLRSAARGIAVGSTVKGGQAIAVMGRSAGGYTIPKDRAHLHFELGFWLGPDFQRWYDSQPFDTPNDHGAYNGMNIVGMDAWGLFQALKKRQVQDAWEFVLSEPAAVVAKVKDDRIPELLKVNPHLMEGFSIPDDHGGWRIEFTWYGLPKSFAPLGKGAFSSERRVEVEVLRADLLQAHACSDMARQDVFGGAGGRLTLLLGRLFPR